MYVTSCLDSISSAWWWSYRGQNMWSFSKTDIPCHLCD